MMICFQRNGKSENDWWTSANKYPQLDILFLGRHPCVLFKQYCGQRLSCHLSQVLFKLGTQIWGTFWKDPSTKLYTFLGIHTFSCLFSVPLPPSCGCGSGKSGCWRCVVSSGAVMLWYIVVHNSTTDQLIINLQFAQMLIKRGRSERQGNNITISHDAMMTYGYIWDHAGHLCFWSHKICQILWSTNLEFEAMLWWNEGGEHPQEGSHLAWSFNDSRHLWGSDRKSPP